MHTRPKTQTFKMHRFKTKKDELQFIQVLIKK